MTHRERVDAAISGKVADRRPVTFWRHFFHKENCAEGTIEAMSAWQRRFDWDVMKINPRADYHVEGWGVKLEYSTSEFEKHRKTAFPVNSIDDWRKITPLPVTASPLDEQLRVISALRKEFGSELPILMTVFTPLAIAARLAPEETILRDHLREDPTKIRSALEAVTETFVRFVREIRSAGADGLFFATTSWATASMLSWEEYMLFGLPFDLQVIKTTGIDALNLLHVCGSRNFLPQLSTIDFNCRLYNWDAADPTNPPFDLPPAHLKKAGIVGGVDHRGWLLHSDATEIRSYMPTVLEKLAPNCIVGPGCAIAPETSYHNLQAVRDSV